MKIKKFNEDAMLYNDLKKSNITLDMIDDAGKIKSKIRYLKRKYNNLIDCYS